MKNKVLYVINAIAFLLFVIGMSGVQGIDGNIQWVCVAMMFIGLFWILLFSIVNKEYLEG